MASPFFGAPPMAAVSMTSQSFCKSQSLFIASSSSTSRLTRPAPLTIICGRGDKKTARGKRFKHSFGNARPRNKDKGRGPPRAPTPPGPPRKFEWYDGDIGDVGEPLDSSKGGRGRGGSGGDDDDDDYDYGYEDAEE